MKGSERHRVKRDELVTVFEKATLFVQENLKEVGLGAGALALVVVGGFAVRHVIVDRNESASMLLGQIIQSYRAPIAFTPEAQQAPAGVTTYASAVERDAKVIAQADDLLARYGSARVAPKALFYKAVALADSGRQEEAARGFEEFLRRNPSDFLAPLARFGLARSHEARGNSAEALVQYQALGEDKTGGFPREEALLAAARCQEALGKKDEALKTYRRILSEFPGSEYESEARSRIDRLS
ncbi:MAG TPA: tetratricopeptide repeat protein [Candidatus Polarisedimenticolia bacterium]